MIDFDKACIKTQLSLDKLCQYLDIPKLTIKKWLNGSASPNVMLENYLLVAIYRLSKNAELRKKIEADYNNNFRLIRKTFRMALENPNLTQFCYAAVQEPVINHITNIDLFEGESNQNILPSVFYGVPIVKLCRVTYKEYHYLSALDLSTTQLALTFFSQSERKEVSKFVSLTPKQFAKMCEKHYPDKFVMIKEYCIQEYIYSRINPMIERIIKDGLCGIETIITNDKIERG